MKYKYSGLTAIEMGYVERTTEYIVTNVATEFMTLSSIEFDHRPVLLHVYAPGLYMSNHVKLFIVLMVDGVDQGHIVEAQAPASDDIKIILNAWRRATLSEGQHVVSVVAIKADAGDVIIQAGSGGTGAVVPMSMRLTRV